MPRPLEGRGDDPKGNSENKMGRMDEYKRHYETQQRARQARKARRDALKSNVLPELDSALKLVDKAHAAQIRADKLKQMKAERLENRNSLKTQIEKFGQAKQPKILKKTDGWDPACEAFLKNDPDGGTKALFLDFDGTMARFTNTPQETQAVRGFLSAVKTFVDKGYKVAVITGRPIDGDGGIHKALMRSGASKQFINKLDIFGSHGIQHRGRETKWKVQIPKEIADMIADYEQPQKDLLDHLQQHIDTNDDLKDSGISIERKVSGATIHYKRVAEDRREDVKAKLGELLSKLVPLADNNRNFSSMDNETYKDFTYNSATESYEIRLNPAETSITLNKGTAVKTLAKRWGVKVAIAFGDDTTDLHMQTKLRELELDPSSPLTTQAFVGVKHYKTPPEIINGSTLVVEGQESSVGLLAQMAKNAKYQTAAPAA